MRVIKRYPNRKLYDTEEKKYVTLEGIAELIRRGEDVQVIDHNTDEDLTAVTLSQIIFEQEKRSGGFLPISVLSGLVKTGGNTVRRGISAPMNFLQQVDDEIEKRLQFLVNRGELAKEDASQIQEKLVSRYQEALPATLPGQQQIGRILSNRGIPSRDEVEQLSHQIEELSTKIDDLLAEGDKAIPTPTPPTE
jgi:polyhydroxyalkanoate synthesis repressor PhaR